MARDDGLDVRTYLQIEAPEPVGLHTETIEAALANAVRLVDGRRKGMAAPLASIIEVSLLLTDDATVHRLNLDYRHINAATDVLSFPQFEGPEPFVQPPGEAANLGDIVVSLDTARRQAAERRHSLTREVAHLTVHGALHLLGYDHQTDAEEAEMNGLEALALAAPEPETGMAAGQ